MDCLKQCRGKLGFRHLLHDRLLPMSLKRSLRETNRQAISAKGNSQLGATHPQRVHAAADLPGDF